MELFASIQLLMLLELRMVFGLRSSEAFSVCRSGQGIQAQISSSFRSL